MAKSDNNDMIRVTLKSYNEPATKRVLESIERFEIEGHRVTLTQNEYDKDQSCDVIVIEGPKSSLLKLAQYIESLEKLAKDWVIPVQPKNNIA
jgi:metal-responsive CopG/Arc/MetJ family transcriptional regulator